MADNKESIILDVKMDVGKLTNDLRLATATLQATKNAQAELTKAFKDGTVSAEDYASQTIENKKVIEQANATIKTNTAMLKANEVQTVNTSMTLDEQRAALNALQKAYGSMTDEQKNAVVDGQTLTERINTLSDSIKKQEAAIGDNRRNVGAYTQSFKDAWKALKAGENPIKLTKNGFMAISQTPLLAIIGLIVKVVTALTDKFKDNQAAMEKLTSVFGVFEGIGNAVNKLIDWIATAVGKLADWLIKAADAMGLLTDTMRDGMQIAEQELALQEKTRDAARKNAEDMRDIAELRAKANQRDKVGTQERLKLLQQASDKEEEIAKRSADLAREAYELQVQKNKQSESSQEELQKENDLYIQMINTQSQYLQKQRELNGQMAKERQKEADEAREAAAVRLEIQRSLQDALINLDRNEVTRQVEQIRVAGKREVENLRIKLNQLKETDEQGCEELQRLIVAREQLTQQQINDVVEKATQKRAQMLRDNAYAEMALQSGDALQLLQFRQQQLEQEYTQMLALTEEQQQALYANNEEYQAALLNAKAAWNDARLNSLQEQYAREDQARENEYQRQLQAAGEDAAELAALEYAHTVEANARLLELDDEQKSLLYANQQEYEAAVIASEQAMEAARKKAMETTRQQAMANAQAVAGVMGSVMSLLDQFGEENKEAAKLSQALALGKIAVETGIAIASGVAQAQSVPFPANIAAIATTISTVLANIATATQTVKKAKFADGGVVGGTSYSGDKVAVNVNSAELISNPKQQANLLYEISNNPARGGIDYERMANAMAAANASLPAPVMAYDEFRHFGERVAAYEEAARI